MSLVNSGTVSRQIVDRRQCTANNRRHSIICALHINTLTFFQQLQCSYLFNTLKEFKRLSAGFSTLSKHYIQWVTMSIQIKGLKTRTSWQTTISKFMRIYVGKLFAFLFSLTELDQVDFNLENDEFSFFAFLISSWYQIDSSYKLSGLLKLWYNIHFVKT